MTRADADALLDHHRNEKLCIRIRQYDDRILHADDYEAGILDQHRGARTLVLAAAAVAHARARRDRPRAALPSFPAAAVRDMIPNGEGEVPELLRAVDRERLTLATKARDALQSFFSDLFEEDECEKFEMGNMGVTEEVTF